MEVCIGYFGGNWVDEFKTVDTPMDPNSKLLPNQGEPISDLEQYRR